VQRLKTLLTISASVDDLGAWVGLDVQGAELQTLVPGMLLNWAPRAGRGLFFDRAQHAGPEVVIVPSLEDPT
jgi:S-DNA-T family DNA segregation ATPase FtsK/SpoIIIE